MATKYTTTADPKLDQQKSLVAKSAAAPAVARESRVCSLTIVMGIFTACLVLGVAAITFAITYTTSLNTLQSVGRSYAESLVTTSSVVVANVFETPAKQMRASGSFFKREGMKFPSEDPSIWGLINTTQSMFLPLFLSTGVAYDSIGMTFDDGSVAAVQSLGPKSFGTYGMNAAQLSNKTALCCAPFQAIGYADAATMDPAPYVANNVAADGNAPSGLTPSYFAIRPIFSWGAQDGLWFSPIFVDYQPPGTFALPASFPVYNRSRFLGLLAVIVTVDSVAAMLKSQTATPNAYTFMIDLARAVAASTHPAPYHTYTPSTNPNPPAGSIAANCASTAGLYIESARQNRTYTIACRTLAKDYGYAPLRAVSSDDELMAPTVPIVFKTIEVEGANYYVAAASVQNSLQTKSAQFKLYMLLFLPETDVIGDVVKARSTVIGIVIAVFILASMLAAVVIHLVLRPLKSVSSKMRSTARLRDVEDDEQMSNLKEVYDLQLAYRRMNSAIGSFTRYVPRDVVKDLMKTGELCQIAMTERRCSMLFVDIASFTTMCERVPADELSRLVRVYFEQMSSIVSNHDGLIDKYIGDCIMAVWGAPFVTDNQEVKAALCAVLIDRETRVEPLHSQFDAAGENLSVRVGVATGQVLAGNMGSSERMSYTVIGDPVNLAARLESMNKQFGTHVMIDEVTAGPCRDILCLRQLLKIAVVGKDSGVLVFEVLGVLPEIAADRLAKLRERNAADSSDSASHFSGQSSMVSAASTHDAARTAATHFERDRLLPGVIVSDEKAAFARGFTEASEMYINRRFADCTRKLQSIGAMQMDLDKSVKRLIQLAEEGSRMSVQELEMFDGVWRSEEK